MQLGRCEALLSHIYYRTCSVLAGKVQVKVQEIECMHAEVTGEICCEAGHLCTISKQAVEHIHRQYAYNYELNKLNTAAIVSRPLPHGGAHSMPKGRAPLPQPKSKARKRLSCASAPPSSSDVRVSDPTAAPIPLPSSNGNGTHASSEQQELHSSGGSTAEAVAPEVLERIQGGEEASSSGRTEEEVEVELSKVGQCPTT